MRSSKTMVQACGITSQYSVHFNKYCYEDVRVHVFPTMLLELKVCYVDSRFVSVHYPVIFEKIFSMKIFLMNTGRQRLRVPCWNVKFFTLPAPFTSHTVYAGVLCHASVTFKGTGLTALKCGSEIVRRAPYNADDKSLSLCWFCLEWSVLCQMYGHHILAMSVGARGGTVG